MEREKPLPWQVFLGCVLMMLSLLVAFVLSLTILGQTIRTTTTQPLATLSVAVLFILRIALVYTGLGKLNEIKQ